jgi:hypothetical protein
MSLSTKASLLERQASYSFTRSALVNMLPSNGWSGLSEGFGSTVEVGRGHWHCCYHLHIGGIARHSIDAAGENHPLTTGLGSRFQYVVGRLDVVR